MTLTQTPRRSRRFIPALAAFFMLTTFGAVAAGADERPDRRDRDRYERDRDQRRGESYRDRGDRRHRRYDRHDRRGHNRRHYDRHRDRHNRRYDRHRDRHRYERHRYDRRHYRDHRYDRRYRYDNHRYDRRHYGHRKFSIPRLIARELAHELAHFFTGRLYYADHGHYHSIYRFPVYNTHGGVDYRPYAYCEGSYFGVGSYRDGRPYFDGHRPY